MTCDFKVLSVEGFNAQKDSGTVWLHLNICLFIASHIDFVVLPSVITDLTLCSYFSGLAEIYRGSQEPIKGVKNLPLCKHIHIVINITLHLHLLPDVCIGCVNVREWLVSA